MPVMDNAKEVVIINGQFKIIRLIGKGSFGLVFRGVDTRNNQPVALKMEKSVGQRTRFLEREYCIYKTLSGGPGIPQVYWYGFHKNGATAYYVLVMELLGPSLLTLLDKNNGTFRLRTVLMLADQMLQILEFLHGKWYAHRDLKPANFVVGTGVNRDKVFLIDFGLSNSCREFDSQARKFNHIINTRAHWTEVAAKITGSARFCSLNVHLGQVVSRRDDIESLSYIFFDFLIQPLPWSFKRHPGITSELKKAFELKLKFQPSEWPFIPKLFTEFLLMSRSLSFEELPDYQEWRTKFKDLLWSLNLPAGVVFDWNDPKYVPEPNQIGSDDSSSGQQVTVVL